MAGSDYAAIAQSWEFYKGFTIRPITSTEEYYRSVLDRFAPTGATALLYGGTPEIRSSVDAVGVDAVIVDRSPMMVKSMGLLASGGTSLLLERERVVQGDWLSLPLNNASVDLAFGDDAVNMVDWSDFDKFMAETHRVLKTGGLVACHLLIQPEEKYRQQTAADVIRQFEAGEISSEFDLASRINFTFYNKDTYRMGWQQSISGLKALLEAGLIISDHGFSDRFANCGSSFACPPQAEWEKLIEPYFSTEEIFYPTEYDYCRFEPLYLLRKK